MSAYILPILVLLLFAYAFFKKVNAYKSFIEGAKGAVSLAVSIFPYIATILVAVALFRASGLAELLTKALTPVFNILGIPPQVSELVIIKPFSGSGSFAILNNIFATHGVDSYIGRCASVIASSSETLFYVTTIYLSKTSVKKLSYAIPVGLFVSILSSVVACLLCRVL